MTQPKMHTIASWRFGSSAYSLTLGIRKVDEEALKGASLVTPMPAAELPWKTLATPRSVFAVLTFVLLIIVETLTYRRQYAIAPPSLFSRHAFLLSGEIRSLREDFSTQLALFNDAGGAAIDIYAVLSPTTKHTFRAGEANSTADDIQLAWLKSLPGLRALRLVASDHHEAYIEKNIPGFPWADNATLAKVYPWIPRPKNIVASFLKRHLVNELMEETLRASAARFDTPLHRYDVLVVSRPDIHLPHENEIRWPHGIQLDDFAPTQWVGLDGKDYMPGSPDSWAPSEPESDRYIPRLFSPDARDGFLGDFIQFGDIAAVRHYCNAIFYFQQLLTGEKGGPNHNSPVPTIDPGQLGHYGLLSDVREATRKARVADPRAPAQGVRMVHTPLHLCLGFNTKGERECGDTGRTVQTFGKTYRLESYLRHA